LAEAASDMHRARRSGQWPVILIIMAVLSLAAYFGQHVSTRWLALLAASLAITALLRRPVLSLFALVLVALVMPSAINTGTEVKLNPATLLIPILLLIWLLAMMRRNRLAVTPAHANRPLLLFLLAGLLSLLIGIVTWDPTVPRNANFTLVQLAQWAIFAFSAAAFWLTANLVQGEVWLRRLTWAFLLLAGGVALLRLLPGVGGLINRFTTVAFIRAPLWTLLAALSAGQLLFNRQLSALWQAFLLAVFASTLAYAFAEQREAASIWVGVGAVSGIIGWLRFSRLRGPVIVVIVVLAAIGVLFPSVYQFAGGDTEWYFSGGSRLALIERVVEVSMRNPLTGLGPAAYRPYANMKPLPYMGAYWIAPLINSHNNYVDLFAHVGLLGLGLFAWFCWEVARLGVRLRRRYTVGFAAGYGNGMLAAGAASLVIMLLADWILPFVYNIGFEGFQASVLVWLFLGGLVALDNLPPAEASASG
jgi:hypothetical protein